MKEFRDPLDYWDFQDLGFVGALYTWCKNQFDRIITWIRLDRGVAISSWIQMFPSTQVHHILGSLSDHFPLWICTDDENARFYRKRRPFRFEVVWMKDEQCEGVIKHTWGSQSVDNPMNKFVRKIKTCWVSLQSWSENSFGNIQRLLQQKKKMLEPTEIQPMNGANHDQVRILKAKVYDVMVKEDCLWQQRSRVDWLKAGDLNTSYFHSRANQRNRRNYISKLLLDSGEVLEEDHKIGKAFVDYF